MKNVRNRAIYNFRLFNIHRTCNVGVTLFKSPAIMVTQAKILIQFMDLVLLSLQVVAYARRDEHKVSSVHNINKKEEGKDGDSSVVICFCW